MTVFTTYVPFPPAVQALPASAGTITNVYCDGDIDADIYAANGTLLASYKATTQTAPNTSPLNGGPQGISPKIQGAAPTAFQGLPFNQTVSLAFTGGAPYVVQRSTSAITLTLA
ncbi:hypothetical protein BurMR1_3058 [Burkholderia sp. MR1]|nr:hypothetical protein BurMR1_3058 [Burkholderia sp. MR1]